MNNISKKEKIIVLDDQKKYVVIDTLTYENAEYGYLCEIGNADNVKFVQFENDTQLSIIGNDEGELLAKLILLFSEQQ